MRIFLNLIIINYLILTHFWNESWSEEEENILIKAPKNIVGNNWSETARRLPGRTKNFIKNH